MELRQSYTYDRVWMAEGRSQILRSLRSKQGVDIPSRLRAFRDEARLTQEGLADLSDVAVNTISEIENGKLNPSVAVLMRLVERGLGVPMSAFFAAEPPGDLRSDLAKLAALFAGQSSVTRRRALRVLRALCED